MAANGLVAVKGATDHDWKTFECVRANELDERVRLVGTERGGEDCKRQAPKRLQPERSDGK